jgi:hypothetical protein
MSTAIIRSYRQAGFVIAADGRRTGSNSPPADYTQKIFDLTNGNNPIACSIAGATIITTDDTNALLLDFGSAVLRAAEAISRRKCRNLSGYGTRISRSITHSLLDLKSSGQLAEYPSLPTNLSPYGSSFAFLYLDGFFDGVPSQVNITFRHYNQRLLDPEVATHQVTVGAPYILGPCQITELILRTMDPRFSAYRLNRTHSGSLEDEVEACKKYILACSDPEALRIDPRCACIGGHIHVATITPDAGFRWSVPPVQDSSQPPSSVMKPE